MLCIARSPGLVYSRSLHALIDISHSPVCQPPASTILFCCCQFEISGVPGSHGGVWWCWFPLLGTVPPSLPRSLPEARMFLR